MLLLNHNLYNQFLFGVQIYFPHFFFFYKQLCDTHAGIYNYFYEINT